MSIPEFYQKIEKLTNLSKCDNINYERKPCPKDLRKEIIEGQKELCWLCKCKTTIPLIHHIQPEGFNDKENIIMLCPLCHKFIHWILKKYLGYRASIDPHKFI